MFVCCYVDQDWSQCKAYFEQVDTGPSTAHFIKTLNVSSLIHSLSRLILIESILSFCPLKGHPDYKAAFFKIKKKKKQSILFQINRASCGKRGHECFIFTEKYREESWNSCLNLKHRVFFIYFTYFQCRILLSIPSNQILLIVSSQHWIGIGKREGLTDAISLWLTWTLQSSQNLFAVILE